MTASDDRSVALESIDDDWLSRDGLWIDGTWELPSGGARLDVVSPSTEQSIGSVPDADAADVDRAVRSARAAIEPGAPWASMSPGERADVLERMADSIEALDRDLDVLLAHEVGRPIGGSGKRPSRPAELLRHAAASARSDLVDEVRPVPEKRPPYAVQRSLVRRRSHGVTAAISPYNGTLPLGLYKIGPTLAAGGSVVFKPPPQAPLEAFVLAEIAADAGLPPGVLNVVSGGAETGRALVEHDGVDMVGFTGSTAAGRQVAVACAERLRPVVLELGGKSAAIVLDDVDVDRLAAAIPFLAYTFSGQNCFIHSRFVVDRRRVDEVVDALVGASERLTVGDPLDPTTDLGPVISAEHRDRVERYVDIGRSEGARVVTGGDRPAIDQGWYVRPTVFADATNAMRICREEIFGPVISVIAVDGDDEAVAVANDSDFGLAGSVWSSDDGRAEAVAQRVDSGTVGVNGYGFNTAAPLAGWKSSGIGVELGREGFASYVRYQSIHRTGIR